MQEPRGSPRSEIAELYTRYGATVQSRCRYLLRDEEAARDAMQEVFVKVMRSIETFRSESSPLTWILRITTNHCLNVIAADRAKWRERFKQYAEHGEEARLSLVAEPERAKMVRDMLGRLDEETQQVAIHYWVDEMTQEEIAGALGRSLPTIRKRLEKFRKTAQKEFGDDSGL